MSFPVHGPFGENPMWFWMDSEDDEAYAAPRLAKAIILISLIQRWIQKVERRHE